MQTMQQKVLKCESKDVETQQFLERLHSKGRVRHEKL